MTALSPEEQWLEKTEVLADTLLFAAAARDGSAEFAKKLLLAHLRSRPAVVQEGWKLVPDWKGYALLGTGLYAINHSAAPPDPELGAELIISIATDKDRDGNRQLYEERATDGGPIQPDVMAVRIGFLNAGAVDALESQLRYLREANFPNAAPSPAEKAEQPQQPNAFHLGSPVPSEDLQAALPGEHCMCQSCLEGPLHASDCAVHNKGVPELYGPCDCGMAWLQEARHLLRGYSTALEASERSITEGGPELDEPFAIAYDALDNHLQRVLAICRPQATL